MALPVASALSRRDRLWPAVSASVVAHAFLVVWALARQAPPPIDLEQKPIVAKLVRLGERRPEEWLPRKEAPPPAPAPARPAPAAVPVPVPAAPAPPRTATSSPTKPPAATPAPSPAANGKAGGTSLASIMSKVQKQAEKDRWGDPNGSSAGDSDSAEGDQYLALVHRALRANYVVASVTVSERERLYLEANIILWIDPDGRITRWQLARPSGNAAFDAAVERTLRATPRVPPPPSHLRDAYRRTGINLVFQPR
jgi:colicin import membrane protein/protein TonB